MKFGNYFSFFLKRKKVRSTLNIKHTDFTSFQLNNDKSLFDSIYYDSIDALIVENFFSKEELDYFHENFETITQKHAELIDKKFSGYTFGKTLFDTPELELYKNLTPEYISLENKLFGFSLTARFIGFLESISNNIPVKVAKHADNSSYLPNSVRIMEPDKGGLFVHADMYIHETFEESKELIRIINPYALLSMIVFLQKPDTGGRLHLYDTTYRETPAAVFNPINKNIFDSMKEYIDKFPVHIIDVKPGALLLFNAGQRWHAIEPMKGNKSRITVGCFTDYSVNNDAIYIWS
jgi:hypothetical protein